jgi:hypothetical protein
MLNISKKQYIQTYINYYPRVSFNGTVCHKDRTYYKVMGLCFEKHKHTKKFKLNINDYDDLKNIIQNIDITENIYISRGNIDIYNIYKYYKINNKGELILEYIGYIEKNKINFI